VRSQDPTRVERPRDVRVGDAALEPQPERPPRRCEFLRLHRSEPTDDLSNALGSGSVDDLILESLRRDGQFGILSGARNVTFLRVVVTCSRSLGLVPSVSEYVISY